MTDSENTRSFETMLDIHAPRDAVWEAITTDVGLRRWFAPVAEASSEVGGEIVWEWEKHHRWPQTIEILEPGVRLRTRYDSQVDDGDGGKRPLWIDFLLEGEGGMTTLRLVQSGFGADSGFDSEYDGISRGWPVELRSLRLYLEQHAGKERRIAWSSLDLDPDLGMSPAKAWQRLTGDRGFRCGAEVEATTEGAPFRIESVDGDVFEGTTLQCHPREFSGDAQSHGGAFFRISAEEWGGKIHIWLWLGAYDTSALDLAALQGRWNAMLAQLFVTNGEAATAQP